MTRLDAMDPVVELIGVSRRHGASGPLASEDVSFAEPRGSFVAVMGATGSGKSTLLHHAAGLDRPTCGTVRLDGRDSSRLLTRRPAIEAVAVDP
jgi:putative ABC transport system ATP-binding protein